MQNTLYYGDNLAILREYLPNESVDLIYLDPPFNSNRNYNVLFREQSGEPAQAQIKAFTDTWKWSESAYHEFCETCPRPQLVDLLQGFVNTLGRNDVTAYLTMMAPRILELHRVLRRTGSLYLHCDPTASHYLKLILDVIFGPKQFKNEIIWKRTSAHSSAKRYGPVHDVIFFYSKSDAYVWNPQHTPYEDSYVDQYYRNVDEEGRRYTLSDLMAAGTRNGSSGRPWRGIDPAEKGNHWKFTLERLEELDREGRIHWPAKGGVPRYKRYLDEMKGVALQDILDDIQPVSAHAKERLGYPTQKPLSLLERFIQASSNVEDVVLDPFCGCGTAITAAQKLGRHWKGIDITQEAVSLIKYRLTDSFHLEVKKDYAIVGEPASEADAYALAQQDRDEFQRWAVGLVDRARPYQEKKGADGGVDGVLFFKDDLKDSKKCVIQVKSGHVGVSQVRDFAHVIQRDKATLGLFITLESPTKPMVQEAEALGFYVTPLGGLKLPRLQIRTVGQLLAGEGFKLPVSSLKMGVHQAAAVEKLLQIGIDYNE